MKTTKWFTCLSYSGKTDILIPQSETLSTSYFFEGEEKDLKSRICDFDEIVKKVFRIEVPLRNLSKIDLNDSKSIVTGLVPQLISIDLAELKVFKGLIGSIFVKKGIVACRFFEEKIQYALDIQTFIRGKQE